MVPVKLVRPDELLAHSLTGVGITPEGEQFAVYNLVGESGVMVEFGQDKRFRYKVLMKDCLAAIRDFHEEYKDALHPAAEPGEVPDAVPAERGADSVQPGGPEARPAGE